MSKNISSQSARCFINIWQKLFSSFIVYEISKGKVPSHDILYLFLNIAALVILSFMCKLYYKKEGNMEKNGIPKRPYPLGGQSVNIE